MQVGDRWELNDICTQKNEKKLRRHYVGSVRAAADEHEGRFHPNEFPAKPLSRNSPALQLCEISEIHTGLISDQVGTLTK